MRPTRKRDAALDVKDATRPGLLRLIGGVDDDNVWFQLDQLVGLKAYGGDEIVEVVEPPARAYGNDVMCPREVEARQLS
jgi:hypothetical protein